MRTTPTALTAFLGSVRTWLEAEREVLLLVRHPYAAGSRDFELHSEFDALAARLASLPSRTSVIAFKEQQLPIRGIASEALLARCRSTIADGTEFLVLETEKSQYASASWRHWTAGNSRAELAQAIEESYGSRVAAGVCPEWIEDGPDVLSAIIPDLDGAVVPAAY
jgi:hypothetical protein